MLGIGAHKKFQLFQTGCFEKINQFNGAEFMNLLYQRRPGPTVLPIGHWRFSETHCRNDQKYRHSVFQIRDGSVQPEQLLEQGVPSLAGGGGGRPGSPPQLPGGQFPKHKDCERMFNMGNHRTLTKTAELFKLLTPRLRYKQMFAALDVIFKFLLHL